MSRTAPGRRLNHSGNYMPGIKFIEQSEEERAAQISADWSRAKESNPDLDRKLQQQYPDPGQSQPDATPPSSEPDQPARQTKGGRLVKGSPEARERMKQLREMRGRKTTEAADKQQDEDNDDDV